MIGRTVSHPTLGPGVVQGARQGGYLLAVQFDDGSVQWLRIDELTFVVGSAATKSRLPIQTALPTGGAFRARRMIEAFRTGIVPYDCAEEFTVGREAEIAQLDYWLTRARKSSLIVEGPYGSGKSHLLSFVAWRALQYGFAVATVEMDFNETPFHKPKRIYGRIAKSLRYVSSQDGLIKGFRSFISEALATRTFDSHRYFSILKRNSTIPELWDWAEARNARSRPDGDYHVPWPLYDTTTAANIYCHLISSLGWAAKERLGLKGLLVIFDEAEVMGRRSYPYQMRQGHNAIRALIRTAEGDEDMLGSPSETGLDFSGHTRDLPFLFRQPSGLKLLFAFASLDWNYIQSWTIIESTYTLARIPQIAELDVIERVKLSPLEEDALKQVYGRIRMLYREAYDVAVPRSLSSRAIIQRLKEHVEITRMFVKGSVEALDVARFNGQTESYDVDA